ncbi:hypothetical protein PV327_008267 [Microctonus hyperodae]|uniref:Ankyrin repeat domain-containing protein 16 n=1 Tax=Microctonus hyperodae TaxID=165561 RepID=A0AA39KH43_MICHY|nr:hypothetical protein PV327_008267 [Microctonus hyperodae]
MTDGCLDLSKEFLRIVQRGNLAELENLSSKYHIENWTIFRHDVSGDTALHISAREGYLDIVKYLCTNWEKPLLKVNVVNKDMKSPLHEAAQFSRYYIVDFLIQQGAIVDSLKRADWTPLMMACTKNSEDALNCIKGLLKAGADLTIRNKDGWTPLHVACRVGNINIIQLLLKEKPECASIRTNNGRTTLHIAAFHGHIDVMDALITAQSDLLHACDSTGGTPLYEAVKCRNFDAFKYLINLGSDVRFIDVVGQTILHVAASAGNIPVIDYVLTNGLIDVHCKDNFGITALALAERNKVDSNCVDLLKKYI